MSVQISVRLDKQVWDKLKDLKKDEGRSYNGIIKAMLEEYKKSKEEK